jgi:hypothetical protein
VLGGVDFGGSVDFELLSWLELFFTLLCAFVVNGLIKGEIEKPCDQFLGLIMMSH